MQLRREKTVTVYLACWWMANLYGYVFLQPTTNLDAISATSSGSIYNQLLITSFGLLGISMFRRAFAQLGRARATHILCAPALYLIWASISMAWSDDPALTSRRLVALALLFAGAFGLGAGFYATLPNGIKVLAQHVIAAGVAAFAVLLVQTGSEFRLSQLADPTWTSPTRSIWASIAAPICMAVPGILYRRPKLAVRMSLLAGFALSLFVLKVRAYAAFTVGCSLVFICFHQRRKLDARAFIRIMAILLCVALFMSTGLWQLTAELLVNNAYFARNESSLLVTSLTGRVPLWDHLSSLIIERPLTGYGFGAFWAGERYHSAWRAAGWIAVWAHNGYLDELLATGVVGLVLLLVTILWPCWWICRTAPSFYHREVSLVLTWTLLLLSLNTMDSLFQYFFRFPFYLSLTALVTLSGLSRHASPRRATHILQEPVLLRRTDRNSRVPQCCESLRK